VIEVTDFKTRSTVIFDCWEFALVNSVHELPRTSPFVEDLLNLEVKESMFCVLDCFLELFPIL